MGCTPGITSSLREVIPGVHPTGMSYLYIYSAHSSNTQPDRLMKTFILNNGPAGPSNFRKCGEKINTEEGVLHRLKNLAHSKFFISLLQNLYWNCENNFFQLSETMNFELSQN